MEAAASLYHHPVQSGRMSLAKNLLDPRLPNQVRRDIEFVMGRPFHDCLLLDLERVIRASEEVGVGCWDSLQVLKSLRGC